MYNYYMNAKRLGSFLKSKRLERGLSRQDLASQLNVSFGHINNIERGDRMPSSSLMMAYAKTFGLTTGYLYNLLEEENLENTQTEPGKPKSRIPDLPPDDPPLSQEKLDLLNDPRIGIMFSMNTLGQLSNRQLNQLVSQIEFFLEENEELKRLIRGNKQDGTSN